MALPGSGAISASMIRTELNIGSQAPFSINSAELVSYTSLNALSISSSNDSPNIADPISMSEWRGYNHTLTQSLTAFNGLRVPYGYPYTTFAQVNLGSNSAVVPFTASNFVTSGIDLYGNVPYSIYYSTYPNITSSRFIKSGVLTKTSNSGSFTYNYNATSGSVVTFLFTPGAIPPALWYDAYFYSSGSTIPNLGTLGSALDATIYNNISKGGNSGSSYFNIDLSNSNAYTSNYVNLTGKQYSMHVIFNITGSISGGSTGMVSIGNYTVNDAFQIIGGISSPTSVIASVSDNGSSIGYAGTSATGVSTGNWYSFITTVSGSTQYAWLNGTLAPVSSSVSNIINDSQTLFYLGHQSGGSRTGNVSIGLVRVWNDIALTSNQVSAEYNYFKSRYSIV